MSVTVKAYLLGKDEAVKEVRRFAVDQDVSSSFEYLNRKTAGVFSNLKNSSFTMFYRGKHRHRSVICTTAASRCSTEELSSVKST